MFGLTIPLLVDSKGNKFGKSAGGALWLDPAKTSPFALYQYLLNTSDAEVEGLLEKTTFLPQEQLKQVIAEFKTEQQKRQAQNVLAQEVVSLVHGRTLMEEAEQRTKQLFDRNENYDEMSQAEFEQRFQAVDRKKIDQLGEIVNLIFDAGLRGTKADARRLVNQGGLKVNGKQFTELRQITGDDLLFGKYIVLKAGKKKFAILELI